MKSAANLGLVAEHSLFLILGLKLSILIKLIVKGVSGDPETGHRLLWDLP